jgi:hypothetical protein
VAALPNGFTVLNTPLVLTINPNVGQPGQQNLAVAITGQFTNFVQGTSVASFGAGITVNLTTVTNTTHATANISIAANAAVGARTVTVTTGAEVASLSNGFTVTAVVNQPPVVSAGSNQTITLSSAQVSITEYQIPTPSSNTADNIIIGPDGNLWFPEHDVNKIGRITPNGTITEFPVPGSSGALQDIAAGSDGNLWLCEGVRMGSLRDQMVICGSRRDLGTTSAESRPVE